MRKFRRGQIFLFVVLSLCLSLFLTSCREQAAVPVNRMSEIPVMQSRPLEILIASPQGTTEGKSEADAVVVTFNQPMTPLEQLSREAVKGPLEFTPPISGKFRWLGTSTLSFIPDKPLPPATLFTAKVPAGTKSLSGETLKEDYQWEFETVRPGLNGFYPHEGEPVGLEQKIFLCFNLPMNPEKAQPFIRLTALETKKNGGQPELEFRIRNLTKEEAKGLFEGWKPENSLVLEPVQKFKVAHGYQVDLQKDLPAAEGNLGLSAERVIDFSTFRKFFCYGVDGTTVSPDSELPIAFSNPVSPAELVKHLSFIPAVKLPEAYQQDREETSTVYLDLDLAGGTTYTAVISPGLEDRFGNRLNKKFKFKFTTEDYRPEISMATGNGLLEAYGSLSYPVEFVNLASVQKRILLLNRETVVPFLQKNDLESDYNYWGGNYSGPFTSAEDWKLHLPNNQKRYLPINLQTAFGGQKEGLLYLQLLNKDTQNYRSVFLQSTNLGVTAKFSPENNLIWVTRLKDTAPVAGAQVELRDRNNRVLWRGKTGSQGLAEAPGWVELGFLNTDRNYYRWRGPQIWVLVSQGRDLAVLSSQWSVGVDPWDFNIDYEGDLAYPEVGGYLFTERGLYLPGEQVHLKGMLRKKLQGQWQAAPLDNLFLSVYNSRNEKILSRKVSLSDYGSFDYTLKLPAEAPTGYYTVRLLTPSGKTPKVDLSQTFQVEAYKPAQFEVNLTSAKEDYVSGDTFKGEISGWYLIGAPMSGEKTEWSLRLENNYFNPPGFEDYSFGNYGWWGEEEDADQDEGRELASGKGFLDAGGRKTVEEALQRLKLKRSMKLVMEATVDSVNRQSVSGSKSWPLHPGEFYIGIKMNSSFVPCNKPVKLNFIAVSPEGKNQPGQGLKMEISKLTWDSVRKYTAGGNYEWICKTVRTKVYSKELRSSSIPVSGEYSPQEPGEYSVRVSGEDRRGNSVVSETSFYVWGGGYVPWRRGDDDRIDLVSDKQQYKPGEKARIMVKSPYEKARALVTVERECVMSRFVTELKGSAQTIEIPLTEKSLPNVYVSVILLQGRKGDKNLADAKQDLGKPGFKIGYINLKVAPDDKKLKVEVKTERGEYRPNDQVTVDIQVNDYRGRGVRSEVCLSAVDLGVLNLIQYATPDPFEAFYASRPLQVSTSELRYFVIGERNYGEKGNRGGGGGVGKALDNLYRKNFKTTPLWKPALLTDANGHARITFQLPENLTSFRVMAVAQTLNSCFGSGEAKIVVNQPLMLKPSLPRFARLGDTFKAGVVVHNGSKKDMQVSINASAEGITLLGAKRQNFRLKKGEEQEVLFDYRADKLGKGKFYFQAQAGKERDGFMTVIPIKENRSWENVALYDDDTVEKVSRKVKVPDGAFPRLEVSLASTALMQLKGGLEYVAVYPHDCLEQRSSKIFPMIMGQDLFTALGIESENGEAIRQTVQEVLAGFKNYQFDNGSFDIWTPPQHPTPYVSVYAMEVMARGKEHGYQVDKTVAKKGLQYLRQILRQSSWEKHDYYSQSSDLCTRCYALYVLSLYGEDEPAYLNMMYEKRTGLPLFARAMLLKALHHYGRYPDLENRMSQEFMNLIKLEPSQAHFEESGSDDMGMIYSSNVRTTAIILQALLEVKGEFAYAPRIVKWLLLARRNGRWSNTQENVFGFAALNTYFRLYEKENPDFTARLKLNRELVMENRFQGRSMEAKNRKLDLSRYKPGENLQLTIDKNGPGRLYYGMNLKYLSSRPMKPKEAGLLVLKTVEKMEGTNNLSIAPGVYQAGEAYMVTLRVLTPQARLFVAVEDPVPAGFEVVNTSFATESRELQRRLEKADRDLQEKADRDWWDFGTFNHWEIYDDKVLLFADRLSAGEHIFTYMIKAFHYGKFTLPATKAEEMYTPEVFGNTGDVYAEIK